MRTYKIGNVINRPYGSFVMYKFKSLKQNDTFILEDDINSNTKPPFLSKTTKNSKDYITQNVWKVISME